MNYTCAGDYFAWMGCFGWLFAGGEKRPGRSELLFGDLRSERRSGQETRAIGGEANITEASGISLV